jgi:ribosomal subunit interface protein
MLTNEAPRDPQQADVGTKTRSAGRVHMARGHNTEVPPEGPLARALAPIDRRGERRREGAAAPGSEGTGKHRERGSRVDIVVKGRHTGVPERFRRLAVMKLSRIEKLDHKVIRVDVEVSRERNPRQSDRRERVELTIKHSGPAVRAEAAADDRYAALDLALSKLESRLRRSHERRKVSSGHAAARLLSFKRAKPAAGEPGAAVPAGEPGAGLSGPRGRPDDTGQDSAEPSRVVPIEMEGDGPLVVREKYHSASPMTIDQALQQMELVGHDFYLFRDSECHHASVVYRRRGYDYGVIRLTEE